MLTWVESNRKKLADVDRQPSFEEARRDLKAKRLQLAISQLTPVGKLLEVSRFRLEYINDTDHVGPRQAHS